MLLSGEYKRDKMRPGQFFHKDTPNWSGSGRSKYTSSLDAIVGLIERDLPVDEMYEPRDNAAGWKFGVERGLFNFIWKAWLRRHAEDGHTAAAPTPAIALCIAYVKGKEAEGGS